MKHQKKEDLFLLAMKLLQTIPDAINAKAYNQSYLKRKNTKLTKQSKTAIIKHPKTSHKLSKAIRQTGKVFQVSWPGKNFTNP